MQKHVLLVIFLFCSVNVIISQTPAWQWAKEANSSSPETAWDITRDGTGGVYTGGSFIGNLSSVYGASLTSSYGSQDGFLAKYDALGTVIWAIKLGGTGNDEVHGVATDGSGNVFVTGYFTGTADFDPSALNFTLTSSGGKDGFLAKYSSAGNFVWAVKFGGTADEDSWKMAADANGVYITGGYESPVATFHSYSSVLTKTTSIIDVQSNVFGAKYNGNGVVQWVISGGSDQEDVGFNVIADALNVYFIGRYDDDFIFKNAAGIAGPLLSEQQNNKPQVFIAAFSQMGAQMWQTNITSSTGGDDVFGWGIAQDATHLYVTGSFNGNINFKYPTPTLTQNQSAGGNFDLYLAKLSKTGSFIWNTAATGNGNGEQIGRALDIDAAGNIILTGCYTNGLNYSAAGGPNFTSTGGHDVFVTAYNPAGNFLWSTKAGGNTRDYVNGLSVDNSGVIYICGEQDGGMIAGTTTLTAGGGKNVFVNKLGCDIITNNTVTASQTICAGTAPFTFTGSLPTGGTIYTWQSSINTLTWTNASGTFTNQNYSSPSLTNTTYFRRIVSGTGTCGTNTLSSNTITIIANPLPSPATAGSNQTICATTTSLNANLPTVGTGAWTVLSGGASLVSPASFSSGVSNLGVGVNQFVWTINNAPCMASSSTVTIIRNAPPNSFAGTNQTICAATATMSAATPTAGVGMWTLLSGSGNITSTASPTSQISSLGTGTNSFIWTVSNGTCTAATSTVLIIRDALPVSNAGLSQTVCSTFTTLAANSPSIGSGFWSVASGAGTVSSTSSYSSEVTGLSVGANSFVWTVSNGTCNAASSTVTIIRNALPNSFAGNNQTLCANAASMSASSPTAGSGVWTLFSGTGNIASPGSPTSQITGLGTGTNSFVWTVSNGNCPPAASTVLIIRDALPSSNAGLSQTVCSASAMLTAISPTVGSGVWSVSSGAGTITSPSTYSTQIAGLSVGVNSFVWTVSNGTCNTATSTVNIVRNAQPNSFAGNNQILCATSATMTAATPTAGSGVWTLLSGAGNITSPASPTSQITSLGSGTNSFVWTVSSGTCIAATSTVLIIREVLPSSNAGSSQTICSTNATLTAISPTIGTGVWTVLSGTATINSPSAFSSQVTGLGVGTNSFVWTVSNGVCNGVTSTVSIVRNVQPNSLAGINQTICTATATMAATSPAVGSGVWSLLGGSASITAPTSPTSPITGLGTGTNSFVWIVSNGVCTPATSTVLIIRDIQPTANAGISQTVCSSSATLIAVSPTIGLGVWSVGSGTASIISPSNTTSQVTGLSSGPNTFVWTVTNGSCPVATSSVNVTQDIQITSDAGADQAICSPSTTLGATTPTSGTGFWSVITGTAAVSTLTNPTSVVSGLSFGTNTLVWNVSYGVCPAVTSTVLITRYQQPSAFAGSSQSVCSSSVTLSATSPTIGSGQWSMLNGTANITSNTNPLSQVTGLSGGTNTFVWSVTNGACPTVTSSVVITRDIPIIAYAGADQTVCATTATLGAALPTAGTGTWMVGAGSTTIASLVNAGSAVSGLAAGANSFTWTVLNGACPLETSIVNITRDISPMVNVGPDQTICSFSTTLDATAPNIGSGVWSVLPGTNATISLNIPQAPVSVSNGTNVFVWTVSNGVCPAQSASLTIVKDEMPQSDAGIDQTICSSFATLAAMTPTIGNGAWTLSSGSGSIVSSSSPSSAITSLGTGTNSFVWTVTNGICPAATSTVLIIRDIAPSSNAGISQTVCSTSVTLSAVSPTPGYGVWSVLTGTAAISSTSSYSSQVTGLNVGENSFLWTVSNGVCSSVSSSVTIVRDEEPVSSAGQNQSVCAATATISATIPSIGIGNWTLIQGAGTLSSSGNPETVINGLDLGINSFVWTVSNGVCLSAKDTVIITRDADAGIPDAGKDQRVCGSEAVMAAVLPGIGQGEWKNSINSIKIGDPLSPNTALTGLLPGPNKFIWSVSNGACPSVFDTVIIQSDEIPSKAEAGKNMLVCSDDITLNATSPQIGSGVWSLLSGTCTIMQPTLNTSLISGLKEGVHRLQWSVDNGVCDETSDTLEITRTFTPVNPDAGPDQLLETSTAQLQATMPQGGIGTWSVMSGSAEISQVNEKQVSLSRLPFGNTLLRWTIANESCPDVFDEVVIHVKNLNIPNAFSPNGDGINDRFVITSLDYYKQVKISVFNRWGNLLYKNDEYHNDWAGVNSNNDNLADDTYYYIIEIPELKNFTGFIIIKRDK